MIKLNSITFSLLTLALASANLQAEPIDPQKSERGLYGGVFGGGGISHNDNFKQSGMAFKSYGNLHVNAEGVTESRSVAMGGMHVGYEWAGWSLGSEGSKWQVSPALEFEGYYLGASQNGELTNPVAGQGMDHHHAVENHTFHDSFPLDIGVLLVNSVWSIKTPVTNKIYPYFGGGIGAAIVSANRADSAQINPLEPGINHFNSNPNAISTSFAAQAKAGLRAEIADRLSLFAEYRFLFVSPTNYTFGPTQYSNHSPTNEWNAHFGSMNYHMGVMGIEYSF